MKHSLVAGAFALSALCFAACSSGDSSSSSANTDPNDIDFVAGACQTIEDSTLNTQIAEATGSLVQFAYSAGTDAENVAQMKALSAAAKSTFQAALAKYPNSCDAQLGLALSLVVDLVNNADIDTIYNAFYSETDEKKYALLNVSSDAYADAALKAAVLAKTSASSTLITDRVQGVIANSALPAIDSAIILLKNVKNTEDYKFAMQNDSISLSVGYGELSLSVGALQSIKAVLTILASYNLDASYNNTYNWVITSNDFLNGEFLITDMSAEQKAAIDHAVSLFNKNSSFLTVKDSWKTSYAAVPVLLDSAITNVTSGLGYLLENAGSESASSGAMIIGKGEDADISTADVQKAIYVLDSVQKGLRGTITVELFGESVQVNASKFFGITDGFQEYLPYHKFTDKATWMDIVNNPLLYTWVDREDYDENTDENYYDYTALAYVSIENTIASKSSNITETYVESSGSYVYYETNDDRSAYLSITWNGCQFSLEDDDDLGISSTTTYQIDTAYCKVENGATLFKLIDDDVTPDFFRFTDASGNETVSITEFANEYPLTASYLEANIFFPDPTFNGVFPAMDQHSLSVLLANID